MTDDTTQEPRDLIGFLDFYLVKKAPFQLPDDVKEWIVQWAPWITVVLLIISLPALLLALGIGAVFLPYAGVYAPGFGLAWIVLLIELGLEVSALPGLFARKLNGWNLTFYARLVGAVYSAVTFSIGGLLIGGLIGLYILFQVRPLYK
jgi:hypothetical protein